jgi:hypothetical protein
LICNWSGPTNCTARCFSGIEFVVMYLALCFQRLSRRKISQTKSGWKLSPEIQRINPKKDCAGGESIFLVPLPLLFWRVQLL